MSSRPSLYLFDFFYGAGFGSEVNNLAYAIFYFEQHGLDYRIISRNWVSAYERGWNDYFTSLAAQHQIECPRNRRVQIVVSLDVALRAHVSRRHYFRMRYRFLPYLFQSVLHPECYVRRNQNFALLREYAHEFRESNPDVFMEYMRSILKRIWSLHDHIAEAAAAHRPPQPYLAVHVRRGDKVTSGEDRHFALEEYVAAILSVDGPARTLFVMSDDSRVVMEFKRMLPDYAISCFGAAERWGYDQGDFETLPKSEVRQETECLIAEVEIAREADVFIGTLGSNLFRLLTYLRTGECIDISRSKLSLANL